MKTLLTKGLCGVVLMSALTLSACDGDKVNAQGNDATGNNNGSNGQEDNSHAVEEAQAQTFNDVLDNVESYSFANESPSDVQFSEPAGGYRYRLADINGDGRAEMIVLQNSDEVGAARIFATSEDGRTVIAPDQLFGVGAGNADGERFQLNLAKDGDGVLYDMGSGMSGQFTTERWTLEGAELKKDPSTWQYRSDQQPEDLKQMEVVIEDWVEEPNRTPLSELAAGNFSASHGGEGKETGAPAGSAGKDPQPTRSNSAAWAVSDNSVAPPANTGGRSKAQFPYYTAGKVGTAAPTQPGKTSEEFARVVYDQYIQHWISTGEKSAVLQATSPKTEQTYTMTCTYNVMSGIGSTLCAGGNNAEVAIYEPIDPTVTKPMNLRYG